MNEMSQSDDIAAEPLDEINRLVAAGRKREQEARLIYFGWIVFALLLLCIVAVAIWIKFRSLNREVDAASVHAGQLSGQFEGLQQQSSQLAIQLANLEKRLQELGKIEKRINDLEQRTAAIQSSKADVALVHRELNARATTDQFDQLSSQLKSQLATKAGELANLSGQIRDIEGRLARVERPQQPSNGEGDPAEENASRSAEAGAIATAGSYYSWVRHSGSVAVPREAFIGGWADKSRPDQPFFICRAQHSGNVFPGRIWHNFCYFGTKHSEQRRTEYEVLLPGAQDLIWRAATSADGAIAGGVSGGVASIPLSGRI